MIPKNVREGAVAQNLTGEKATFSIKMNGKAFRALIDGLYSNKIRSVIRELCSNAADSHIAAGQAQPFRVSIPTHLDPTFRVRDYGTSLDHEDVMVLYATLFESTKEETNEQTGMLGLGSKSPFAYTDSFSVVAYKDGRKRVYLAYLETDGVPSITFVNESPSSEPQGLEVSFPAKRDDIRQFTKEMQFVAMGYETPPQVDGMDLRIPKPRLKGTGWAIYPRDSFGGDIGPHNHFIRQGTAVYPTDQAFPHIGYGWLTIVDIPIGTAEVTTSREALAFDAETKRAVQAVRDRAYEELKAQVQAVLDAAKTRVEKARVFQEYNGVLDNLKGSTIVSLVKDLNGFRPQGAVAEPGEMVESAEHWAKSQNARGAYNRYKSGIEVNHIPHFRLIVNDPENKIVRRTKRIRNQSYEQGMWYVLDVHDPQERKEAVKWITDTLELKAEQVIVASDIPDCPPDPTTRVKKPSMKRVLKPGQFWMPRREGYVRSPWFGQSERGARQWPKAMTQAARVISFDLKWDEVFWVTEKQEEAFRKKGQIPDNLRLDNHIKAELDKVLAKAPLDEAQTLVAITRNVGSYNRKALEVVMAEFFPDVKINERQATDVLALAELAKIDLRTRPIVAKIDAKIRELVDNYPLLFQKSDRSHYEHYVKAVKAASAKS